MMKKSERKPINPERKNGKERVKGWVVDTCSRFCKKTRPLTVTIDLMEGVRSHLSRGCISCENAR